MIARVNGTVQAAFEDRVHVSMGPLTLEVLLPRASCGRMRVGQEVTFHTHLVFEGSSATGKMAPILLGFETPEDLRFFDLLTTVKGMGTRKTLKAFAAPAGEIAMAIERSDERTLKTLPEIGMTMAKRIVVELKGKAAEFLAAGSPEISNLPVGDEIFLDAMDVLAQLGYKRIDAERMVARVLRDADKPATSDELVRRVLRTTG